MNVPSGKQPATWQDYEGSRQASFGSVGSHVHFDEEAHGTSRTSSHEDVEQHEGMRRRRYDVILPLTHPESNAF
jgi:hypothetical protein